MSRPRPKNIRKVSDIWKAIEDKKTPDITIIDWKRSYQAINAAIEYIGYKMITTKEEFDAIPIPKKKGGLNYGNRKIIVERNGINSIPTSIDGILTGYSSLQTTNEKNNIRKKIANEHILMNPKGLITCNNKEMNAINKLHELLNIEEYLDIEHLIEHRISDVAYRFKNENENAYVADQVKSAYAKYNKISFSIKIGKMISILEKNMSLTCIVIKDDKVDIVWYFNGTYAIDILNNFDINKEFEPTLHSLKKNNNPFTIAITDPKFRYDVGKSKTEIERLLKQKLEFVHIGVKHSIEYLNEDDSQILCINHRIEHKSFAMTRTACATIGINVKKYYLDNYTSVDFRINNTIKIQDKSYKQIFRMRSHGSLPYDPNTIDIMQISNLVTHEIYAIPMRIISDNIVQSMFNEDTLMKIDINVSQIWDKKYAKYKYNLKTEKDIYAYVATCQTAANVPILTNRDFYKNMIDANKDMFGSLKQIKERKKNTTIEPNEE